MLSRAFKAVRMVSVVRGIAWTLSRTLDERMLKDNLKLTSII